MSCKNCSNGCPASEVTGKNCDPVEAEDLVIEFENQGEIKISLFYNPISKAWTLISNIEGYIHLSFKLLKDAKECAEILKRSV